jgi:hypothetical protein
MGLADIVRGMRNGPRGERQPNSRSSWGSRLMYAALGLLAYKAVTGRNREPDKDRSDADREPPRRRWL